MSLSWEKERRHLWGCLSTVKTAGNLAEKIKPCNTECNKDAWKMLFTWASPHLEIYPTDVPATQGKSLQHCMCEAGNNPNACQWVKFIRAVATPRRATQPCTRGCMASSSLLYLPTGPSPFSSQSKSSQASFSPPFPTQPSSWVTRGTAMYLVSCILDFICGFLLCPVFTP